MAKKRFSTKPTQPKDSAPLEEWKKYKAELAKWEKEDEEKKKLIEEIRKENRYSKKKR